MSAKRHAAAACKAGSCCGATRRDSEMGTISKASMPERVPSKSYQPESSVRERTPSSRHALANFFREVLEIRHHHFRFSGKARAQRFVLRGDADRAGIQMALPGHDATNRQQRRGAKSKFIGAQNRRENNVARKFQASVHAERKTRTEARANQSVMRFAQTNFPRQARYFLWR